MKVKNTKHFIEFCSDIGIKNFYSNTASKKNCKNTEIYKTNLSKDITLDNNNLTHLSKIERLKVLKKKLDYVDCEIKKTATNLVFSDGNVDSKLMFIGEAPGADEDKIGIPFVGQAGKLLDQMIKAIGLNRNKDCYITNIVVWRPPGNRNPSKNEIELCLPILKEHIEIINPKLIILLGGVATNSVLNLRDGITLCRGKKYSYKTNIAEISCWPIFHPAFLLRNPLQKKNTWDDLRKISKELSSIT